MDLVRAICGSDSPNYTWLLQQLRETCAELNSGRGYLWVELFATGTLDVRGADTLPILQRIFCRDQAWTQLRLRFQEVLTHRPGAGTWTWYFKEDRLEKPA